MEVELEDERIEERTEEMHGMVQAEASGTESAIETEICLKDGGGQKQAVR